MIRVLYFARLREFIGADSEQMELPEGVEDVDGLRSFLLQRGGAWAEALGENASVLVAVNQEMAAAHTRVRDGDEVAFFPPVTGG